MRARDLVPRIHVARRTGLRALGLLGVYVSWLSVTTFGPAFTPPGGWTLPVIGAVLVGYSLFTVATLLAVGNAAIEIVRVPSTRRAISHHVAPFWAVVTFSALTGAVVARYGSTHWLSGAALGFGVAFAILLGAYAAARIFQVARLESDRKQLAAVDMLGPVTLF